MTGTVLEQSLRTVILRLQKLRILRLQTVCWLLFLVPAIAVTLWLPSSLELFRPELPVLLSATILGTILSRLMTKTPTVNDAARLVEQTHPNLNDAVITAVQVSQRPGERPSVLAAMAIQDAERLARQDDWSHAVSGRTLAKWTLLSFLSFVVMVSSVMAASRYGRNLNSPLIEAASKTQKKPSIPITQLVIEPGDTEIERGSALTVVARFPGAVPTIAVLEFVEADQSARQLSMTETVDAGIFAARMEEISGDGTYHVSYAEVRESSQSPRFSPNFKVTTYVRPKLEQVDAVVTPPAWSGRAQESIEDVMRMTVTEGSTVVLKLRLNKPVAIAELQPRTGPAIGLVPTADDPSVLETTIIADASSAWIVRLQDAAGRTQAEDEQILINVSLNQPAQLKATFPGKDAQVSPLQEFLIEASASDDFGIVDAGVQYSLSGRELNDITLNHNEAANAPASDSAAVSVTPETRPAILSTTISHQIDLESLNAAPDEMVTYSFWASDIAPDGSERRSYSDIMFAEVRRFEEIFRESQQGGEQQPQNQQQQQGSAADGILKLQKEIISATWNTIRAEGVKRQDGTFAADVSVIAESQGQAMEQLTAVTTELGDDPQTTTLAQQALGEMAAAKQKLEDARDGKASSTLSEAMQLENAVLYTLLRMRASEFEVQQKQQQGGGGGGGSSASQQQMQQLELDNSRNRYETEKQAQQQQEQTQQQREQVRILNRLKELARRQQMVNERLKQLESELRAATTDKEREEIERELKRLRDEQREMLRDVDELGERMEQAADRQKPESAQMQQQMEQARENVQQTARAMDEGNLAEAISEGTRAERQFEELKEEFRSQTSSQFDDAMRDLRDQARELNERQEELARQLTGDEPATRQQREDANSSEVPRSEKSGSGQQPERQPSLRAVRDRQQLQKDTGEQRDRLNRVVEQTKQIIEQAEQTEPLLSNKLYDTLRELKDSKPDEALQATEILTSRGMWAQSQQAEQAARRGIEQLKTGIEQAADSVLGSEAESLRRARSQLQDATEKLASEVQNAAGEDRPSGASGESQQPDEGVGERSGSAPASPGREETARQEQTPDAGGQSSQESGSNSGSQPAAGLNQSSSLLGGGRESNSPRSSSGARPLTGSEFTEWSDQLRDVEEMLDDPELRNRVAQVRDRAKSIRAEFKRHGAEPQWDLVKSQLLNEMQSLQQRITQELARRESDRAMVPIDREPVPEEFDSLVQKYYELLGHERDPE